MNINLEKINKLFLVLGVLLIPSAGVMCAANNHESIKVTVRAEIPQNVQKLVDNQAGCTNNFDIGACLAETKMEKLFTIATFASISAIAAKYAYFIVFNKYDDSYGLLNLLQEHLFEAGCLCFISRCLVWSRQALVSKTIEKVLDPYSSQKYFYNPTPNDTYRASRRAENQREWERHKQDMAEQLQKLKIARQHHAKGIDCPHCQPEEPKKDEQQSVTAY